MGRVGKQYPASHQPLAPSNSNGNQQINYFGERYGWIIALLIGIVAIVAVTFLIADLRAMRAELANALTLIQASADRAATSAENAAVAADRTDRAERRANIAEAYAKQVYVELNRLGYPVQTPIEEHSVAPVEAYKHDP